jgi:hypothetical protein
MADKADHLGTPPIARAFTVCNQGDIAPSDQMIVYLPATDSGPSIDRPDHLSKLAGGQ